MRSLGLSILSRALFSHIGKSFYSTSVKNLSASHPAFTMRAVKQEKYGGPETLYIGEEKIPEPGKKQLLVEVHGTAVNRADLLMSKGFYPGQDKNAPPSIIGLEMAGVVKAAGDNCSRWKAGNHVMGLVPGASYAEYVTINEDHAMPVPDSLPLSQAGGLPEVWLTAYQLLHFVGNVKSGDFVLIHGGGSGVGTAAVQLVRLAGATPLVTAGSLKKIEAALALGAQAGFNYKDGDFAANIVKETQGVGANLILDCVGGSFWKQNIACLAVDGMWVNYGLLGGGNIDGNLLGQLLVKRGSLVASMLKTRSDEYKGCLASEFTKNVLPYFAKPCTVGDQHVQLKPVVDKEYPIESVSLAHEYVSQNKNIGKVLLKVK